jgi:RHS repeat-associated protein
MYPVYADLVLSVYAGSGDGYITSSPYGAYGSWDIQRNNYIGRDADYTDIEMGVGTAIYNLDANYLAFRHGFLSFDTSSLPENINISNADLKLYVRGKLDGQNDQYSYLNVVEGRQVATSSLVNTDYGLCGNATTSPSTGSSDKDITGISTNAYTTFNLNATGTAWISTTGYTKLCLRDGHDMTNHSYAGGGSYWKEETVWFATSETSGTSSDPYLEITYTAVNNAPSAPTNLLTENQTNPSNLMTVVPKFSAIFNDDASDTATYYKLQVSTTSSAWDAGSLMWDSGQVAISTTTNQGTRSQDITYAGTPWSLNGATYYWRIKFWDASNAEGAWSSGSDYFNLRNIGPTSNYSNCVSAQAGTSTPTDIRCGAPLFSAIQSVDIGTSTTYWMQVATTSDFSSTIWSTDSSGSPIANLGNSKRSPDIAYLGLPLDFATTTYYWRVKFGNGPYGGSWSDTNVFTTVNANVLQNLYYTYDAVGNITKIIDHSDTNAAKTMEYTYDDLNRLLTASSTNAENVQDYYQAYSYDALGNITNKSDIGTYTYSSNGYTNPHAVTTIGSTNYSYDNNGNLTSSTGGFTNTWNYKNQLTQSGNNLATSTYAYDHAGNRVRRTDINPTTVTTYYPSEYYNFHNGTTTKHIYAGNQLIASVQSCVWPGDANRNGTTDFTDMAAMSQHYNGPGNYSEGDFNGDGYVDFSDQVILSQNYNTSCPTSIASTTVNFVHTDHLTGSNIVSDGSGAIIENMDYYPFGEIRIDDKTTSFNEQNKFTGHDYDALNGYSYMKARYQDGKIGRFISQDPVFLNIGSLDVKKQKVLLSDPQQLNSYSYAENNPLKYVDPDGKQAVVAMPALFPTIGFSLPNISVPVTVGGISIYIGVQGFKWVLADPYFGNQTTPILNSKNNSDQEQPLLLPAPSVKVPTNVFPKDPADLLPELPRDEKGRIHPNETTRIRPEKHGQDGGAGNPRHTDQHYHVEIRPGPSGKYNTKLTPPGYKQGDGTGFLPGEQFPGSTIRIMP